MQTEKYKVGDTLICQPGWNTDDSSGGAGYIEGRTFKVGKVTREDEAPKNVIYWPEHTEINTSGIYGRAVKKKAEVINDYPIY